MAKLKLEFDVLTNMSGSMQLKTRQIVDIPIVNLYLEGSPVKIGCVNFMTITEQELIKWKNKPLLWPPTTNEIQVFARVEVQSGSQQEALSYARAKIDQVLNVLRAFRSPFGKLHETWQIGMLSSTTQTAAVPMRINNRQYAAQLSTQSGFGPALIELRRNILSKVEQAHWDSISKVMLKSAPTEMEKKLLIALQWLGESTKQDRNDAKCAKICFALETMIGGEPTSEDLKVRGITAMLAERAAFIAGKDFESRLDIDQKIRKYYGKRSEIVHKGQANVSLAALDDFGALVRKIALALLEKLDKLCDKISDVDRLEIWVKSQRYALPG